MAQQLTYAQQAPGFAGMLYDLTLKQASTFVQAEASAEIPFGVMVAKSAAPSSPIGDSGTPAKAINLADANSLLAGIAMHSNDYDRYREIGTVGLKPKTVLSVLERGRMWVNTESAVARTDKVYVRHTANGPLTTKGAFRTDADTANAVEVFGAKWITETAAAGLAVVEIDMAAHVAGKRAAALP